MQKSKTEKILIADDDKRMRALIKIYLETEGYSVGEAGSGRIALEMAAKSRYDLIILDVMMPDLDGWSICRNIRETSQVPIIFLTARGEEFDKVLGLELGADDYIIKPFSPRELVARVNALLRRSKFMTNLEAVLEYPGLSILQQSRQVKLNGKHLSLTPKEFDLLYFLAKNKGRVLSREQLAENVWGYNFFGHLRTIDTHIKQLREKLGQVAATYIKTVWGVGYKFEVEP